MVSSFRELALMASSGRDLVMMVVRSHRELRLRTNYVGQLRFRRRTASGGQRQLRQSARVKNWLVRSVQVKI